jgi:hypothetical protein
MTKQELDLQHSRNCNIIAAAIGCLDLETCVNWQQVQLSKTDDLSYYMRKIYEKKKSEKGGNNDE